MKKFLLYSLTAICFAFVPSVAFSQTTSDGDESPAPEVVATPVINPDGGAVATGTQVTITCETEGATIYYTLDGTKPTNKSSVYSEPLTINEITVVNAIAEKADYTDSAVASVLFTISDSESKTILFDFTDHEFLMNLLGIDESNELFTTKEGKYPVQNKNYTYEDITVAFSSKGSKGAGANPRFYNNGNIVDFRFYLGQWFSVTCNTDDLYIQNITFTSNVADSFVMVGGEISDSDYNTDSSFGEFTEAAKQAIWVAPLKTKAVKLFNTTDEADKVTTRISSMTVSLTSRTSGAGNVAVEDNAPVEYLNLQGVRVANPSGGNLYIVRQGSKVTKVIVK